MALQVINEMDDDVFKTEMLKCCHSTRLANDMVNSRPFESIEALKEKARSFFLSYEANDFLEAFEGHPRIGEAALKEKFGASAALSENEQSGAKNATAETISELSQRNDDYFNRYGFIFIVCATGKSAEEMLEILNNRMDNDKESEIIIAAKEQDKITQIRLGNLFHGIESKL